MKRVVIFDLDGTLIDSEDFIVWSFVEAGRVLGLVIDERLVRPLIGRSLENVVEAVFKSTDRVVVEKFLAVRESLVRENWRRMIKLFSDVAPALRAVYVGDREVDCVASSRAGVDFIMVNRRGEASPSVLSCRPRTVVKNLLELPGALSKL
ncbi:MAG: HAD hydrolase-like protein [Desulfurococcaceae archaeon]|nr:HAD hydrolase-like protein [Desulfurococcaceae archaeon]